MKNYFFDFDKTLVDSGNAALKATKTAFLKNNLKEPKNNIILDFMGIPPEVSFFKMSSKNLTNSELQQLIDTYRRIYMKYEKENTFLYSGMRDVLESLCKNKKELFVVSSKNRITLKRNLDNLNITKYFTDYVGCDDVKNYKPAPDGIILLLEKYVLSNKESVMIGDAKYDLQMGKAANVKTAGAAWDAFDIDSLKRENPDYLLFKVMDINKIY